VTADFTTWNFFDSVQNTIYLGTKAADSVDHCYHITNGIWPFSLFFGTSATNPLDFISQMAFSRLGSYMGLDGSKHFQKAYDLIGSETQ